MRQIIQKSQIRINRAWTGEIEMVWVSYRIGHALNNWACVQFYNGPIPESLGLDPGTEVTTSSCIWTPDHDSLIQKLEKPQPQDQRTTRLVKRLPWTEAPPQGMKKRILPKVPEHRTSLRSIKAEFHGPELREQHPRTGKETCRLPTKELKDPLTRMNLLKWCTQGKLPPVLRPNVLDRSPRQSR